MREFMFPSFRLLASLLMVLVCLAFLMGCCGSLNTEFVKAVDANWSAVGPSYKAYLDADKDLTENSKMLRLKTVVEFELLIREAKTKAKIKD